MEQALDSFIEGLRILTDPSVILMLFLGGLWGLFVGVVPGLGAATGIGVMVSLTYKMEPVTAVVFLVAISVANSFGNGLPAAVFGIAGGPAGILTAIEGAALTKRGQGALAVATNWFACVFGQFISIPLFLLLIVPLSGLAWVFLSPEMFALYFLGMAALVGLTGKNVVKSVISVGIGLTIGIIGPDPVSAVFRYDFLPQLRSGISPTAAVLGLVVLSELLRDMRQVFSWEGMSPANKSLALTFPGFRKLRRNTRPMITGSLIGTLLGSIPGLSGTAASILAYNQAKMTSKHPEEFGRGSTEGLAANEAAGNASQAGEMVPTLALGIPGSDTMVLLLGALMLQGFVPGPRLMTDAPELLHATAAGLIGTAVLLLFLGWSAGKFVLHFTRLDRQVVLPLAFALTLIGVYVSRRSGYDVIVALVFGVVGYFMIRYGYSVLAASVAMVLGAGFEMELRTGLLLMRNDPIRFISRPWTAVLLGLGVLLIAYGVRVTVAERRSSRVGEPKVQSKF